MRDLQLWTLIRKLQIPRIALASEVRLALARDDNLWGRITARLKAAPLQNGSRVQILQQCAKPLGATVLLLLFALAGCRQDMHNQPKFKPLRASEFFADGRSARPLLPGTVDRSDTNEDPGYLSGLEDFRPVETLPFPVTRQALERGRERFNIYCMPCHGELGDGNGMVAQRGYLHPPSLHDDRLRQSPVGHFFDVITNGLGGMPDYSQQIPVDDRWKIIAYIRALQLSEHATLADVPAEIRSKLAQPMPPSKEGITGKTGMKGMAPPVERKLPPETGVPEERKEKQ